MRAILCERYGPPGEVLRLAEVDEPAIAGDEVLVRVRATSVNPADWHLVRGVPHIARLSFGPRRPRSRVPGCDVAGEVVAVGTGVTTLRPGDEVYGSPFPRFGAFAELVAVPADHLERKPANLSFDEAAAVPVGALTALQGLRDHGRVEAGHRVLIIGAAGGVGTFAMQIAKTLGAEVTAVCSTGKVEMARSLGADDVIDYTVDDVPGAGPRYELVLQVAGTASPTRCRRALTSTGALVQISGDSDGRWVGPLARVAAARLASPLVSQRLTSFTVRPSTEDLRLLRQLIEAGDLTPVIGRTHSLDEVPEAIRHLEEGHARGKSVIVVET
jgi:NADPH:quinone reductase-like Zn-dependent oxidoreductase